MAVVSVTEAWSTGDASEVAAGTNLTIGYDVILDSVTLAKLVALTAVDPDTGLAIPNIGAGVGSGFQVIRKEVTPVGPLHFTVEVEASTNIGGGEMFIDPLSRPPDVRGGSIQSTVQIENDVNGDPILNTADEPPDPPVTDVVFDPMFRITWNRATIPPAFADSFANRTNADFFQGAQPGQVLVQDLDFDLVNETVVGVPVTYWRVTVVLVYREGLPFQAHDGTGGPSRAWWSRYPNRGFREKVGVDGDGLPIYRAIVDEDGNRVSEPVLLALDGTILGDADDAVFIEVQRKKQANLAALGIPI